MHGDDVTHSEAEKLITEMFKESSKIAGVEVKPTLPNLRAFLIGLMAGTGFRVYGTDPGYIIGLVKGVILKREIDLKNIMTKTDI